MKSKPITFKLATCNLQSLPRQASIRRALNSMRLIHLRGMQECDPLGYKQEVFARYGSGVRGIGTPERPKDATYSCPIAHNRRTFIPLQVWSRKIYDGHSGISYTRHLTSGVYLHKASEYRVGMVNVHSVVAHGDHLAQRKAMKASAKAVTRDEVGDLLAAGLPVAVTGDFNDTANWFGEAFMGHRVQRVGRGIDQVLLIDGAHHFWTVLSSRKVKTPSDHDTIRVKVRLTAR